MSKYWAKRTAKSMAVRTDKSIAETEAQMRKYYQSTLKKTIGQFEATYNKLLLSMEQGKEPTPADLYKLDKYWELQGQLSKELEKLGDKQVRLLTSQFIKQYKTVYENIALKGEAAFSTMDDKAIEQMINQIWCADSKSWSSRVWTNTSKLQEALNRGLVECVAAGRKSSDLKKMLMDEFNVSYARANTLIRTEMAHIQTQAAQQRYRDYGIQEVEVLVDKDTRTCDVCAELEGKKYPINGAMPVPAHPNCRCCIVPVVEVEEEQLKIPGF